MLHALLILAFSGLAPFQSSGATTLSAPTVQARPPVEAPRTCGLGATFHGGRRAALLAKLEGGIVLVRGLPATRDYTRFSQDKVFWYLTGVESPNATLVVDVNSRHPILFLPKADAMSEMWEGEKWDTGDEWVAPLTGIEDIRPNGELLQALKDLTATDKVVWISKEPHVELAGCRDRARPYDDRVRKDPLDGRTSREDALEENLKEVLGADVRDLTPVLDEMRRVKTREEIDAMRRAGRVGADAMIEAMRSTRPGIGEWDVDALMTFVHRREGAAGPAYHAIVGSGPNSLVLHYSASSRVLAAGDALLVDYAPEVDHYTCDITRSWPVDGTFTPRMTELYDAVLAAQEAGIATVQPGRTMQDVEKACRKVLASRGMGKLMPHGACHYIGMEVHDVGKNALPLEPGVCFTVEPGAYEASSGIGIRIEDVVVVTTTGCEVLSAGVPKDRKTIVELIRSEGILDRDPPTAPGQAVVGKPVETPRR